MTNKILKGTARTPVIGTVAAATRGKEKGGFYVVVGVCGDKNRDYVLIADGKTRKIENPKKKNVKHISATKTAVQVGGLTNKQLRIILNGYIGEVGAEPSRLSEEQE